MLLFANNLRRWKQVARICVKHKKSKAERAIFHGIKEFEVCLNNRNNEPTFVLN